MSREFDASEASVEKTQMDNGSASNQDNLDSFRGQALQAEPNSSNEVQAMAFLPSLDLGGAADKVKSIASDAKEMAGNLVEKTKDFAVDTTNTLKSIPKEDWKELGKSSLDLAQKHGATLAVDTGVVVATDGTNVLADGKLALDLYKTVTSDEGKELGRDIVAAWKHGNEIKNAKQNA